MNRPALVVALAGLTATSLAFAQPAPGSAAPPAPSGAMQPYTSATPPPAQLDAAQSAEVQRQVGAYRAEIDARIARGEISPDEAGRLLQWREWQIRQQVAGLAPPPGAIYEQVPVPVREYYYRPYYAPYPYYYGPAYYPAPYYFGASVCAGGWGRHFGGRFCI